MLIRQNSKIRKIIATLISGLSRHFPFHCHQLLPHRNLALLNHFCLKLWIYLKINRKIANSPENKNYINSLFTKILSDRCVPRDLLSFRSKYLWKNENKICHFQECREMSIFLSQYRNILFLNSLFLNITIKLALFKFKATFFKVHNKK